MNKTAERARTLALKKHRRQLLLHKTAVSLCVVGIIITYLQGHQNAKLGNTPPPPIQKVKVLTYGFLDKKGVWRSYDNGEEITVINWRP